MSDLEQLYFSWLCSIVEGRVRDRRLLEYLHYRPFYYILPIDANRFDDGVALRYRFASVKHIDDRMIASEIDIRPCSILEMMVALSLRIEEHIMANNELGDRTSLWFWGMIKSLGIKRGAEFNIEEVNDILYNFLERRYEPNGAGGLFTLNKPREDLRKVEIWYQANWYLNELL